MRTPVVAAGCCHIRAVLARSELRARRYVVSDSGKVRAAVNQAAAAPCGLRAQALDAGARAF